MQSMNIILLLYNILLLECFYLIKVGTRNVVNHPDEENPQQDKTSESKKHQKKADLKRLKENWRRYLKTKKY